MAHTMHILTRNEAAEYLGLSPATLATWASRGKGPAFIRLGKRHSRTRYYRADLDAWLEAQAGQDYLDRSRSVQRTIRAAERHEARFTA